MSRSIIICYLMKPNRPYGIVPESIESIRNQTFWSGHEPRTIIRYPKELYEGKGVFQLFKLIDVMPSELKGNYMLNTAIWICINHCVLMNPSDYICVWFDDIWVESDALKRAINSLEYASDCDCIGLPPIEAEHKTFTVPLRWFVFKRDKWRLVPISELIKYKCPQLYLAGLHEVFNMHKGESIWHEHVKCCFLDCDFKHLT